MKRAVARVIGRMLDCIHEQVDEHFYKDEDPEIVLLKLGLKACRNAIWDYKEKEKNDSDGPKV